MSLVEDAGSIGDALRDAADANDVLLIVGAGACGKFRLAAEDRFDAVAHGGDQLAVLVGMHGMNDHQVFDVVFEFGIFRLEIFEHLVNLAAHLIKGLLREEATIEDRT